MNTMEGDMINSQIYSFVRLFETKDSPYMQGDVYKYYQLCTLPAALLSQQHIQT